MTTLSSITRPHPPATNGTAGSAHVPDHHVPKHHVVDKLDAEWASLRHDRRAIRRVNRWAEVVDPGHSDRLARITDLGQFFDLTHRRAGAEGEELMATLVGLVRNGDADGRLAGRILVQRLIPGVIDATRRYRALCEHADPVGEAIGVLWIAINRYDLDRRHGPIAPALISDTMFIAFRRRVRQSSTAETPHAPLTFDERPTITASASFIEVGTVIAEARHAGVPTYDLDLLRHLIRAGRPGLVARQRQITPRTVRNHRDRAVERIQRSLGLVAA